MKKIFVINCNPKEHSSRQEYLDTYINSLKENGHEIRETNVYNLNVDYLRAHGDEIDYTLTLELKEAQDNLIWADQLVFSYPVWCLAIPPILNSFISKVFAEGVACKSSAMGPKPLMKDKTAVIMQSYSMPLFAMKYFYKDIPMKWWKVMLTDWCGPRIVKRFDFDMIDNASEKRKEKWIKNIKKFAKTL